MMFYTNGCFTFDRVRKGKNLYGETTRSIEISFINYLDSENEYQRNKRLLKA